MVRALAALPTALWHRTLAADLGLARLTLATRGTLSTALAGVLVLLGADRLGVPPVLFASGVTLALMTPFLAREPTRRQRWRTTLALAPAAAAATTVTGLLHGRGVVGDAWFVVLVFLCFLLHPRHPRMIGLGLVAVVTTYVGLFLRLPPDTLPLQLLGIIAALPVVWLSCFVLVPLNPVVTLRRTVRAVQGRAAAVLEAARAVALDEPGASPARLRRELARLTEAALAADDLLALLQPDGREAMRSGLIGLELATVRLAELMRDAPADPRQATRLRLHARRLRRGAPYALPAGLLERGSLLAALVELGHAVHALGVAAALMTAAPREEPPAPLPPGPLGWRTATRVTLAAALAMAGGMALSPQRWFWAVIAVYVVFLNARSRGDTLYKGTQRIGGTLLGIASGLVLATALGRDPWAEAAALLGAVFGMYYTILVSYTAGIFCVTVMLGLLYGLLGAPFATVLLLRLEETAIGVACAMLVAAFVLPVRTREQVRLSGQGVLRALVEAVRASRLALAGTPAAAPMEAIRRVDRQVADLRLALIPLTAGRTLLRRTALERPVPALLDCVHWARALAVASQTRGEPDPALVHQAWTVESRLAALAGLTADGEPDPRPSEPPSRPEAEAALARLGRSVTLLSSRLEINALAEFHL